MKKLSSILWGIVLIAAGVIFGLNALEIVDVNIFFDGWWTLFIIVPCAVGVFSDSDKTGNIFGLVFGVLLLLNCQGILTFGMLWKLAVAVIVILVGIKLIFGNLFGNKGAEIVRQLKESGGNLKSGTATFSGQNMNFDGEIFEGAELNAVFGGVKCDVRNAVIAKDCVINASAIFGGIDILLPDNVNVKVSSNSVFGGVSEKKRRNNKENAFTVYVNATCMFGGVEIK